MPALPLSDHLDDDLPDCVREAEATIAGLADSFLEWASQNLAEARRALAGARAEEAQRTAAARTVYGIAHNIKGQGGTFGYDLVGEIAGRLCAFVKESPRALAPAALDVAEAHLAAIGFVLDRRIRGGGGAVGARLLDRLRALAETAGPAGEG